jgi:hypothetical protein
VLGYRNPPKGARTGLGILGIGLLVLGAAFLLGLMLLGPFLSASGLWLFAGCAGLLSGVGLALMLRAGQPAWKAEEP